MGKLFLKDLVAYFGLCKFLNNLSVLCFGTNLLGHPLLLAQISLVTQAIKNPKLGVKKKTFHIKICYPANMVLWQILKWFA